MTLDRTLDCHMHSTYSDGSKSIDALAASAVEKGLKTIAITDHMPLPFATRYAMARENLQAYRHDIARAREKYRGRLTILAGLEMEYLPDHKEWIRQIAAMGWDMLLVSIHGLEKDGRHFMVNGREDEFQNTLETVFNNDIKAFCSRYYTLIQEAALTGWFDAAGHLDVIKKHNRNHLYFDESSNWYTDLIHATLETIAACNMKMEINTNGLNHPAAAFYPSDWIIAQARKNDIPIVLGSDAHAPRFQGQYFNKVQLKSRLCC